MSIRYKNHTIKINITDIENNIYYKNNPQYFLELKSLIETYPRTYKAQLCAKGKKKFLKTHPNYVPPYKHLKIWVDEMLKNTKIADHKYPEKCYWIMHGMTDFNKCQNINCNEYVTYFYNINIGYLKHCKNKSCQSSDPIIKLKREETNLKTYGVRYPAQSKEIWHKVEQTCLKRYKNKNVFGSKYAIQKSRKTKLERYGDENYRDVNKAKQTKLKHFGTACSPSWTYKYNDISFDSSWELSYYIWLTDNKIDFKFHPKEKIIHYTGQDNKQHIYTPDFWLIKDDIIVEIKGNQFFDKNGNLVVAYNNQSWMHLYKIMIDNNVCIIKQNEVQKYLKYVENTYGKDYLKQFKKISSKI